MVSNTFATPQASKAINLARVDFNQSMLSIATNFYGPSLPTSADITILGTATAPSDGWMYRNSKNGVLYIKDSANSKGLAGDFTVNGIGSRIIESLSDYYGQESDFDLGELFKTVGSNARLYIKKANTTGDASIADVGLPTETYSITRPMLGNAIVDGTAVSTNVSVTDRNEVINGQKNFTGNTLIISNTSATATVGPDLELFRDSTSAAVNDYLGRVLYTGNNGSGNNTEYAAITSQINDNTNGSEDASLLLSIIKAGTLTEVVDINEANTLFNFDVVTSQSMYADVNLVAGNALISTNNVYGNTLHVTSNVEIGDSANVVNDLTVGGNVTITGSLSTNAGAIPTARAFIINNGSASIGQGSGVDSVSRTTTGTFTVNLTDTMDSINYSVFAQQDNSTGFTAIFNKTTTSFQIVTRTTGTGTPLVDTNVNVLVLGVTS